MASWVGLVSSSVGTLSRGTAPWPDRGGAIASARLPVAALQPMRQGRLPGSQWQLPRSVDGYMFLSVACLCVSGSRIRLRRRRSRTNQRARIKRIARHFVVALGGIPARGVSRWYLASEGTPRTHDDPDGSLMMQVETIWLTRGLENLYIYLSSDDRMRVFAALRVAALAHQGQKRKSGEPYIIHPVIVAELLASLKVPADVVIAGLLHDTVEDNPEIKFKDIEDLFGKDVRFIVEAETKVSKRTGLLRSDEVWNRLYKFVFGETPKGSVNCGSDAVISKAHEQSANLRDLFLAMADDYRVILVKLADRLHNMRTLEHMPPKKQETIALETLAVFAPLAHRLGFWLWKSELEDLSFKYAFPSEFSEIDRQLTFKRAQYRKTLVSAANDLSEIMRRDAKMQSVPLQITSREKGMYSLWCKLRNPKYHSNLENITDIIALRIVLDVDRLPNESDEQFNSRGSDLCYYALSVVHNLYAPPHVGASYKDYIKQPKPNGYQSLHTILKHPHTHDPLEVQIRTRQMHDIAEYGMAAHFSYKDVQHGEVENPDMQHRRVAWLESIKSKNRQNEADPIRFVQDVLREELGKRCFIFLRNGQILNLSRGCTVLDAAFNIRSKVGLHMVYPQVNGVRVDPSYTLQNGDSVNIVTSPDASPKLEWLQHAAWLRSTQEELIAYFRQKQKSQENQQNMIDLSAGAATFATGMAAAASVVHALLDVGH